MKENEYRKRLIWMKALTVTDYMECIGAFDDNNVIRFIAIHTYRRCNTGMPRLLVLGRRVGMESERTDPSGERRRKSYMHGRRTVILRSTHGSKGFTNGVPHTRREERIGRGSHTAGHDLLACHPPDLLIIIPWSGLGTCPVRNKRVGISHLRHLFEGSSHARTRPNYKGIARLCRSQRADRRSIGDFKSIRLQTVRINGPYIDSVLQELRSTDDLFPNHRGKVCQALDPQIRTVNARCIAKGWSVGYPWLLPLPFNAADWPADPFVLQKFPRIRVTHVHVVAR